jgi:hypothetical protein
MHWMHTRERFFGRLREHGAATQGFCVGAHDHGAGTEISAALNGDLAEETKHCMSTNLITTQFSCKGRGPLVLLGLWA